MAARRMFASAITSSDAFLDMPSSAQALYFHLCLSADDDGFVNCANKVRKMIEAPAEDMKLLEDKGYVIPFSSGIIVIRHWCQHNCIQKDRYKPTVYQDEKALLTLTKAKVYELDTECSQDASEVEPQMRKDQHRGEEVPRTEDAEDKGFVPPTLEEVQAYCSEREYGINATLFHAHYTANGWMSGNSGIVDWRAAVDAWKERDSMFTSGKKAPDKPSVDDRPDILDKVF